MWINNVSWNCLVSACQRTLVVIVTPLRLNDEAKIQPGRQWNQETIPYYFFFQLSIWKSSNCKQKKKEWKKGIWLFLFLQIMKGLFGASWANTLSNGCLKRRRRMPQEAQANASGGVSECLRRRRGINYKPRSKLGCKVQWRPVHGWCGWLSS